MDSEAWLRLLLRRFLLPGLLFALSKGVGGLRILDLNMPTHASTGQGVTLECVYSLDGDELYSVKWYKDSQEFFRYLPNDDPVKQIFELPGITVNQTYSDMKTVRLENVELTSSGKYRCEVSAEAPSFTTVELVHEMTVYDLPDGGPQITGIRETYNVGDTVNANCTAIRSRPAAHLEWHINGDKATPDILHKYPTSSENGDLETSVLGLEFKVEQSHFVNGEIKLNCTASLSYIYNEIASKEAKLDSQADLSAAVLQSQSIPVADHNAASRVSRAIYSGLFLIEIGAAIFLR